MVSRREYQAKEREKEAKLKELEEIKTMSFDEFEKNEQMREDNRIEKDKIEFENMMDYDPEFDKIDELT